MANYGDVALQLPANWDRAKLHNISFARQTVGHKDGVSDAYITKEPDAAHKFYWVAPKDPSLVQEMKVLGYTFVNKKEWTINTDLWEWDAEGFASFGGERLMALPAAKFEAREQAKADAREEKERKERKKESALGIRDYASQGLVSRHRA